MSDYDLPHESVGVDSGFNFIDHTDSSTPVAGRAFRHEELHVSNLMN